MVTFFSFTCTLCGTGDYQEEGKGDQIPVCVSCRVRPTHLLLVAARRPTAEGRRLLEEKALEAEEKLTLAGVRVLPCNCAFRG